MRRFVYVVVLITLLINVSASTFYSAAISANQTDYPAQKRLDKNIAYQESSLPPSAQWNQTYGGAMPDEAYALMHTVDGGYALAGYTYSSGASLYDFWLVKTDAEGDVQWNQTYGGANDDKAYCAAQTNDDGYAISGFTASGGVGGGDFWLVKTDVNGNAEWNHTYGGTGSEIAYSVAQTADGGYIMAGITDSFGAGAYDFWLVKTDSAGNMQWNQTYGGTGNDYAYSAVPASDGGYAVAGGTWSFGAGGSDFWLVKTDSAGNMQWNRTYGGLDTEEARSMVKTGDGGYALVGYTFSFAVTYCDFWLIKITSAGNVQWNQTYEGTGIDWGFSAVKMSDSGFVLAGATASSPAGKRDFWIAEIDVNGDAEWNQTHGGTEDDYAYSVVQTGDGGCAVVGWTKSFGAGASDFWLLKFQPSTIHVSFSAWASLTPKIDGVISPSRILSIPPAFEIFLPGEWDDAAQINFTLTLGGKTQNATLYEKNDNINLYLALKIEGEEYNDLDSLEFEFDNNDNAVRELGDNVLSIQGNGEFNDLYINNATSGAAQNDLLDGGTDDGVGSSNFTSEGDYYFEMAYPLDTSDDVHDFGMLINSTLGLKVDFYDHDVGQNDAWPSSFWYGMAHVRIAGPPVTPPASTADLSIFGSEVTQAIQFLNNSLSLVQGKTTVVRLYIGIGSVPRPVSLKAYLYGLDEGIVIGTLIQSFDSPLSIYRGNREDTLNFILPLSWVNRSSLTLRAFIRATSSDQSETDYSNNWMTEQNLTFHQTEVPTIYILPVNSGTYLLPVTVTEDQIIEQEEYLRAVYPVADVNFVRLPWQLLPAPGPGVGSNLNSMLTSIGYDFGLVDGGIDQIYGFTTSGGGLSDPLWSSGHGIAACGYFGTSREGTLAHEINHNLGSMFWGRHAPGGGAKGPDPAWPYADDTIQTFGVDTSGALIQIVDDDTPDFMSYNQSDTLPTKWISPYRWEHLLNRLWVPSSTITAAFTTEGESLRISGWVSENGTGHINPIFTLPGERESSLTPGNFSVILKDSGGNDLSVKTFHAEFEDIHGGTQDPYYFSMLLPNNDETARVLLTLNNITVLDNVSVSQNAPIVELLSPNGGEVWGPDVETVEWTATDVDGGPLTYMLYHSPDNGVTWAPISPMITEASYQINASDIQGSETSLLRVVASDGFNIGQDETNTVFTVTDKPPVAKILRPENQSRFLTYDIIVLYGRGVDVDDATLPRTAYNWTSNIDGYLGDGDRLTTTLTPGTHKVTLTVTDSQNNTAEDELIITVTLDVEITSITPSKTVVGAGLSLQVNTTVENLGHTTRNFTVSAEAYNESYATSLNSQPVSTTLHPGNSTTLTFNWNTTGLTRGNYTVRMTINLTEYELTGSSDTVTVALIGDITGPDGWPDGKCDMRDIGLVARYFGQSTPPAPVNCDITGPTTGVPDGIVDMRDVGLTARHFGETYP